MQKIPEGSMLSFPTKEKLNETLELVVLMNKVKVGHRVQIW